MNGKPAALGVIGPLMTGPASKPLDSSKLVNLYDYPLLIRECRFTIYGPSQTGTQIFIPPPAIVLGSVAYASVKCGRYQLTHSPNVAPINAIPIRLLNTENPNVGASQLTSNFGSFSAADTQPGMPVSYEFARWAWDPPFVLDPGEGFDVNVEIPAAFTSPVATDNLQVEVAFVGESLPKGTYPKYVPYACAFVGTKGKAFQQSNILELSNRIPDPVTVNDLVGFLTDFNAADTIIASDFSDTSPTAQNDQSLVLATLLDPTGFQIARNMPFTMLFDINRRALRTRTVMPPSSRYSLSLSDSTTRVAFHTPYAAVHGYRRVA